MFVLGVKLRTNVCEKRESVILSLANAYDTADKHIKQVERRAVKSLNKGECLYRSKSKLDVLQADFFIFNKEAAWLCRN